MTLIRSFGQFVPAFILAAGFALPLSANGQDEQNPRNQNEAQASQNDQGSQEEQRSQEGQRSQDEQASRNGDDKQQEAEDKTRKLEVFELEHRDPDQINRIISMAEQATLSAQPARATAGQAQQGRQAGLGQSAATTGRTTVGYRGASGDKHRMVTAINAEEKILFVRGSDEQVEMVKELVDAFDVEDQELKRHEFRNVRLIPVRTRDASQVQSTLSQLDLQGQMLRMGETSVIVFQMDETNQEKVDQAETVIETLNNRGQDRENGSSDADEHADSTSNSDDGRQQQ